MKAKVIRNFRDKYSNTRYKENEELEITEERFEEINSTSFGILVEEIVEESTKEDEETEDKNEEQESKVDIKKKSTKK